MRKRLHALKRPKIRADWSKENLYNLARMGPTKVNGTFFQQKWAAKARTRAFHGEQINEGQWERMFSKTLPAVAPMDVFKLARSDGSEEAAGRGSGEDLEDTSIINKTMTPYMQMVWHPIERRLDNAVWRALFSSSARQARQFVVHGWVKVNGKTMKHPGYMLNAGDMFQVDPDRVLFATGARKDQNKYNKGMFEITAKSKPTKTESEDKPADAEKATSEAESSSEQKELSPEEQEKRDEEARDKMTKEVKDKLKTLQSRVDHLMKNTEELSPARKQELRGFRQVLRKMMSKAKGLNTFTTDDLEEKLDSVARRLAKPAKRPSSEEFAEQRLADHEESLLQEALTKLRENPFDRSKPYLTPWRPRPYMSAFAFIPPYLEVNQNVCAAVFLRPPVARPGMAEVPTPFPYDTNQLAFNWYLRRR
ncbi:hypothetical protein HDK77DRAFT_494644 [Phyllosticta capitalensis]|uniref:RNA-binding S4 domain-containing protein n=1 Tax=Phyllosticta capitalensis TaxID=121624 RepID=A0ABR1Y9S2_9PEZI